MKYALVFLVFCALQVYAQQKKTPSSPEEIRKFIVELNQRIDQAVVDQDTAQLLQFYGDDFVFTHGTGTVDSKKSWIGSVRKMKESRFISRQHDSTQVELHGDVALLTGTLSVAKETPSSVNRYALRYVRLYAYRDKRWQLISHRTTSEWHL